MLACTTGTLIVSRASQAIIQTNSDFPRANNALQARDLHLKLQFVAHALLATSVLEAFRRFALLAATATAMAPVKRAKKDTGALEDQTASSASQGHFNAKQGRTIATCARPGLTNRMSRRSNASLA
jgi:hypothetical protein